MLRFYDGIPASRTQAFEYGRYGTVTASTVAIGDMV
jgi:hypothetical protein